MYELSSTNLMSCCYSAFELLLLDTRYVAICLLPARGCSLAAIFNIIIRQLLACRVPVNDMGGSRTEKMIPVAT